MDYLTFDNGDTMPAIGLGTWKSKPGEVRDAVIAAIQMGYRHIDCAAIYGNETEIGEAFAHCFDQGWVTRSDLWVTSKLWSNAHAKDAVQPALEKTLADLRLDYLDLYLIHWPVAFQADISFPQSGDQLIALADLPLEETWRGMAGVLQAGLTRHIGVSNCSIQKLRSLLDAADQAPELNQIELHPYLQQPDMLSFCESAGIKLTAYAPLGSSDRPAGLKAEDEPILLEDPVIQAIAIAQGCTPAQVLIQWAVQRGTSVIPKSVNPDRLKQNLAAQDVQLTDSDMARIAELDRHRRYVSGAFWAIEGSPYTLENLWDESAA